MAEARRVSAPGHDGNGGEEAGGRQGAATGGLAPARPARPAGARGAFTVRELIAQALAELGLITVWVESDGNCLFRALSVALVGDESLHEQMRARVCDYMMSEEGRPRLAMAVDGGFGQVPVHVR